MTEGIDTLLPADGVAIMGILNITPDSFSDGGQHLRVDDALCQAMTMVEEGADLIDVGGESTRPGARAVSAQQELDRVIPVIERIHGESAISISIDTSKAEVMRDAVVAGASLINDVRALREDGALQAAAELDVPVCLMHMQGEPRTMQHEPSYGSVVQEVRDFLAGRIEVATEAGIAENKLIIDPGFGFGKALGHNFALLRGLAQLQSLGRPILIGVSRKSMIEKATGLPLQQRLHASVALALLAVQNGAGIVRVHDVAPHRQAIRMMEAVNQTGLED
ncbi:MAG: dihydropteroate synthase [Gammaproteobacteria bacterium]|nr:MAG: dihydropteroate synthase [Gammaproteobacteria bacterium]